MITIQDMEILIECKRLVEKMLNEKRYILEKLNENGNYDERAMRKVEAQIVRMERALQGKPPVDFFEKFGGEV